jgi:hypothetical protein
MKSIIELIKNQYNFYTRDKVKASKPATDLNSGSHKVRLGPGSVNYISRHEQKRDLIRQETEALKELLMHHRKISTQNGATIIPPITLNERQMTLLITHFGMASGYRAYELYGVRIQVVG